MAGSRSRPWQRLSFISILFLYCLLFLHLVVGYAHNHRHLHQLHHHAPWAQTSAVLPQALAAAKPAAGQGDYTCGPDKPCSNKACCGEDGWCGYSPKYCGKGCQSHCDAKAECGQYAKTLGQKCPLNVCCSQHGFCGTTSDFCDQGCQSNCETPKPNAAPSNPQKVVIGYWEAWNMDKPCGTMGTGEIPVELLTHLFVSFGYINSAFEVTNMDGIASHIYKDIGHVKARNPSPKVVIALGGWAFSDPGPWKEVFPKMVSTEANRAIFINNLLGFLSQYGYDGVDFDWEYPGADDRGGTDDDGKNYVALLKELREAINAKSRDYIVTFTATSSYWYLRHFDLNSMQSYVNWINLMSYDLHGIWDGDNPIGHQVLSHTNLTEIDSALNLFWRFGVDPSKVVLGLGFYGRSFELESASCWKPGCKFKGPGSPGRCSKTAGILSYAEIMEIVDKTGGTPYFDEAAAARYMVYDGNSWISFDDPETFQIKIDYASNMGLHGLMIWAVDLDSPDLQALKSISNGELIGRTQTPFSMVDLERIFPKHISVIPQARL
ncbi:related to chitinase [Fusarium fujikuroi IMI 58289]|uniref:chitinase n=1 Tax=Gibberella fujikuroi (strain CBS 195.34 / IMI 58289 / NRRL A-6831) TaxID=1279085 RepID=S0DUL8_GIBF5|nr:related to chitinase [Fusarium fujikuroi IMI 58289]CCT65062.1 related to chitinase [Fusarium fujikuroi IMI 58289]